MQPSVSDVSAEAMAQVLGWARQAEGFVKAEAPLLAREIVAWHFWGNAIPAGDRACNVARPNQEREPGTRQTPQRFARFTNELC